MPSLSEFVKNEMQAVIMRIVSIVNRIHRRTGDRSGNFSDVYFVYFSFDAWSFHPQLAVS
jgi:hypothetical protein